MMDAEARLAALEARVAELEQELYETKQIAYGTRYSIKSSATRAGYQYNLLKPLTLNAKIHWLAVNYWPYHPLRYHIQDKYLFKYYFASLYGEEYTIPSLGVWDSGSLIDFDALPERFVLKRTIGGGAAQVKLVDKKRDNLDELRRIANSWTSDRMNAPARVLAEQELDFPGDYIVDYKVYVADGKARMILVAAMRKADGTRSRNFFDLTWTPFPIRGHQLAVDVPKPDNFDEIVSFAEMVATAFPLMRVDFYNFGSHFYVGELTTLPFNGYGPYAQFNRPWGDWVTLPTKEEMHEDFEAALDAFPEVRDNPVFLKDRGPRHRLVLPNSPDGALPVPPPGYLQPNDPAFSLL